MIQHQNQRSKRFFLYKLPTPKAFMILMNVFEFNSKPKLFKINLNFLFGYHFAVIFKEFCICLNRFYFASTVKKNTYAYANISRISLKLIILFFENNSRSWQKIHCFLQQNKQSHWNLNQIVSGLVNLTSDLLNFLLLPSVDPPQSN